MSGSIFDRVRAASATVAERARHVEIDRARIPEYARSLPLDQLRAPELDPRSHYLGRGENTAAFVVTLDAINFGSGYFPHLRKRPNSSGYFTVASSLADRFRAAGPILPGALAGLTAADCAEIFEQDLGNEAVRELMELYARALNDLGGYLLERFDGSFVRLIDAATRSAQRLLELLAMMPFFRDVEHYEGLEVPFYKRAQLTAADLALAFSGHGLGGFDDLDRLTIFADNLIPHVLRVDGVLRYAEDLARRIDAEELIPAGSPEEVEIRACALHAVELIGRELRATRHEVTAMHLDYLLWNRGQAPAYKQGGPRHRTRTVSY